MHLDHARTILGLSVDRPLALASIAPSRIGHETGILEQGSHSTSITAGRPGSSRRKSPFGVPSPVTLSHPGAVRSDVSAPSTTVEFTGTELIVRKHGVVSAAALPVVPKNGCRTPAGCANIDNRRT